MQLGLSAGYVMKLGLIVLFLLAISNTSMAGDVPEIINKNSTGEETTTTGITVGEDKNAKTTVEDKNAGTTVGEDKNAGTTVEDKNAGTTVGEDNNAGTTVGEDKNAGTTVEDKNAGTTVEDKNAGTTVGETKPSEKDVDETTISTERNSTAETNALNGTSTGLESNTTEVTTIEIPATTDKAFSLTPMTLLITFSTLFALCIFL